MSLAAVVGVQLALVGLVAFGLAPRVRQRWPSTAALAAIVPSLLLIGGISLVLVDVLGGATPDSSKANPVAATVTSVDAGNRLYQANCAACHGVSGEGGGPLANTTPILPPSLKAHLTQHTDGDLFYWITSGLPGGMPAWAATLSETDRWNVINYLRAINAPGASIVPLPGGPSGSASSAAPPASAVAQTSTADAGAEPSVAALVLPAGWLTLLVGLLSVRWRRRHR